MSVAIPTMVVTKLLFYYIMAVSIIEDGVKKLTTRNVTNIRWWYKNRFYGNIKILD